MIRKLQSGEYRLYSRKVESENWKTPQPRNVQIACRSGKTRSAPFNISSGTHDAGGALRHVARDVSVAQIESRFQRRSHFQISTRCVVGVVVALPRYQCR